MTVEVIISIIGAIGGWELIRYVLNLRTNRRKEDAEACKMLISASSRTQPRKLMSSVSTSTNLRRAGSNCAMSVRICGSGLTTTRN